MEDNEMKSENEHKDFYVVKPQRGNIHGLMPQPPVKQSNMNVRDTHTQKHSTPSLTTRLSGSPTLLPIQGVSYTSKEQLPIQGPQTSRKISLLNYLDPKILVKLP